MSPCWSSLVYPRPSELSACGAPMTCPARPALTQRQPFERPELTTWCCCACAAGAGRGVVERGSVQELTTSSSGLDKRARATSSRTWPGQPSARGASQGKSPIAGGSLKPRRGTTSNPRSRISGFPFSTGGVLASSRPVSPSRPKPLLSLPSFPL